MEKQPSFFQRLSSNPIIQTIVVYASGSWLLVEMSSFFIDKYDLSERILDILLIVLVCGFPVALVLVWYLSKRAVHKTAIKCSTGKGKVTGRKRWWFISGAILVILILSVSFRLVFQKVKSDWAIEKGMPEKDKLLKLYDTGHYLPQTQLIRETLAWLEKYRGPPL